MNVRVRENLPRTNNILEKWHNYFAGGIIPHAYPDIWEFPEKFKGNNPLNHIKPFKPFKLGWKTNRNKENIERLTNGCKTELEDTKR